MKRGFVFYISFIVFVFVVAVSFINAEGTMSCPQGYHWDSATNSCVTDSSTGTTSSCPQGYYWDSTTNSCKAGCDSYTSSASCTSTSGCVWDSGTNHCSYSSSSSSGSGSSGSGSTSLGAPSTPGGLSAAVATGSKDVGLIWTDTASNTETFKMYRRKNGGSWELIATQPYSLKMYNDPSLPVGSYEYHVVACNSSGCSGQSNIVFVSLAVLTKTITGSVTYADGTAVTDAKVSAWNKETNESKETGTASNGSYTLAVSGGSWELYVYPATSEATWSYNQSNKTVLFSKDETAEQTTATFTVVRTESSIKGKVLKQDGSVPDMMKVHVNLQSSGGSWFGGNITTDGSFMIKVAAGTYNVSVNFQDSSLIASPVPSVSVASGETKDVGTITLVTAPKTIMGSVKYSDGTPVTNAYVSIFRDSTKENVYGEVDSTGTFSLHVSGGYWQVSMGPTSPSAGWNYNAQPTGVTFANDETAESLPLMFTVTKADAEARGTILKPDGTPLPAYTVSVGLRASEGGEFNGSVDASGGFRIPVPAGTYTMSIWSNDKTFAAPQLPSVTIASGEVKNLGTITLVEATKTITGTVTYSDGRFVTDASVGAFNKNTQQWVDVPTTSSGNYSLKVLGGTWEVSVHPTSETSQWSYGQEPSIVTFKDDVTGETKSLNFVVTATDAAITGKILLPDGTPPPRDAVYPNAESSDGQRFGGSVDSTGVFRLSVTAGTYKIFVWGQDSSFTAPSIPSVTVAKGGTADAGTIYLIKKTDHINGFVRDENGKGIGGVEVSAWMPTASGYASAKTDATGFFDILVTPGTWEVHAYADPSTNYYSSDPPKSISISSGVSATVNFTLRVADAGISGTIIDSAGAVLSNLYGFANLSQSYEQNGGLGGQIERGVFSFKAPAGIYSLFVFLPPESSYTAGEAQTVTLRTGETTSVKVGVAKNTATITGTLKDEKGTVVTGIKAQVFATTGKGSWQETLVNPQTGQYALRVAAGTWYLGYDIDPASGYLSHHEPNVEVTVAEGGTGTKDLVVKKASAVLMGRVTDPTGTGVFNAFVGVSKTSFSGAIESEEFKDPIVAGTETDANGTYRLAVSAGSYFIKTFVAPDRGFINSKEVAITIADGETKTLDLQMRKADLAIIGSVFLEDAPIPNMFVWGWSNTGGYQETFSGPEGIFRLNVTASDTWTIAAGGEITGAFYKSNEILVKVGSENVMQDIHIAKYANLAEAVVQTSSAAEPTVVEVKDGVTIVASANAISLSGSVSISATPDTRAPSQGEVKVVGVAYDLAARDETGQQITLFNTNVTVTIPYTEENVIALGAREDDLVMSFWDEANGTWKTLESSVVNKEEQVVTASVNHFTRFAIVAAADISPPAAPTKVVATALAIGGIGLTWINPSADFHHAKVYRSLSAQELGISQAVEVLTNIFTDTKNLVAGTLYYYTVRAVDAAGNESANTDNTSATALVSSAGGETPLSVAALPSGQAQSLILLERNLTLGNEGVDVTLLQQLLLAEGVYPEGRITGYFGSLTRKAVVRFQEKYRAEILRPAGLSGGTGFVGPSTRAKINTLLGTPTGSALPATKSTAEDSFERNLTLDNTSSDVTLLQQLLLKEGVYPEGLITGYFGSLTQKAVIRFQEKYRAEILLPVGLSAGTGFVGPSTRMKMNVLLGARVF